MNPYHPHGAGKEGGRRNFPKLDEIFQLKWVHREQINMYVEKTSLRKKLTEIQYPKTQEYQRQKEPLTVPREKEQINTEESVFRQICKFRIRTKHQRQQRPASGSSIRKEFKKRISKGVGWRDTAHSPRPKWQQTQRRTSKSLQEGGQWQRPRTAE